jgi:hypothetical protein
MDKWLESFGKWPPVHQMVFSAVMLLAALVLTAILVYVLYLVIYYAAVAIRGWPDDTNRPTWKDIAYLSRTMEAYRQWEKQQQEAKKRALPPPASKDVTERATQTVT